MADLTDATSRRNHVVEKIIPAIDIRPYIGGDFADPSGSATVATLDPMTEKTLVDVPEATPLDVARAVSAARDAFDSGSWSLLHPRERAAALLRLADLIESRHSDLVLLESTDAGKRIAGVSGWDISNAVEVYRYYAGWADKIAGDSLPNSGSVQLSTRREPAGVCAAIVGWNFPFPNIAWKLAPALAAGCTVVLKTAERAPLSGHLLAMLVSEAGIPDGVVNIVSGSGSTTGAALVSDPRIDVVSFTGGTETGKKIAALSAPHLSRLALELGSKNPVVIFEDADLELATTSAAGAMFAVSGQDCGAGARTYVQRGVYDQFLARVVDIARARKLGDPLDFATEQGPQIDRRHLERIDGFVQRAVLDGAECLTGGRPDPTGQCFYEPTVLSGLRQDMEIMRSEVFGPVGCVVPFDTLDEVVHLANDTDYGLAAAVWTRDESKAESFVARVRAGTCWVNCYGAFDTAAPWGGIKHSGHGRELGAAGLDTYTVLKTVGRAF